MDGYCEWREEVGGAIVKSGGDADASGVNSDTCQAAPIRRPVIPPWLLEALAL
jgi:hypothetical protein